MHAISTVENCPMSWVFDTNCVVEVKKLITGASLSLLVAGSIVGSVISTSKQALATSEQLVESKIRFIIDRHLLQSTGRLCTNRVPEPIQEDCCSAICKNQPATRLCFA